MTNRPSFRTSHEEVIKLLGECVELRNTFRAISGQLARVENRIKRAFPAEAEAVGNKQRARRTTATGDRKPALTSEQALAAFEEAVRIARAETPEAVERFFLGKRPDELIAVARELGLSFPTSNPSAQTVIAALKGRLRESLMLSKHTTIRTSNG